MFQDVGYWSNHLKFVENTHNFTRCLLVIHTWIWYGQLYFIRMIESFMDNQCYACKSLLYVRDVYFFFYLFEGCFGRY